MTKISQRDLAGSLLGGLAHVHTRLSNFPGHYESDQTVRTFVSALRQRGLVGEAQSPVHFVVVNEHASNPLHPKMRLRTILRSRWRWRGTVGGLPVYYGYETSLLPDGEIDLSPRLAKAAAVVIASRHRLPTEVQANAEMMTALFARACQNPLVDVLGHPARHIESLGHMQWQKVFAQAAATGTAVEINLNSYPDNGREPAQIKFWERWLAQLEASGADIFIGTDLHNEWQLKRFLHDWKTLGEPGEANHLAACLMAIAKAGIGPDRVVTSSRGQFDQWLRRDKLARAHVASI